MEEELGEISFDSKIYYNNNDDGENEEDYQDSFEIPMTNAWLISYFNLIYLINAINYD